MKKTYLDQCVLSNLAGDEPQDWRKTKMGEVLASGIEKGKVEVWASPTHVLETLLCAEYDPKGDVIAGKKTAKRTRIAQTLLELCEGKRMACSYEFILVGEFLALLRQLAPACIRTERIYERLKSDSQKVFAGALALLAALPGLNRPAAAAPLIRSKLTTQLLHSRFAKDPDTFVEELIAVATEFRLTGDNLFKEIDERSLSELRDEINKNLATKGKLKQKSRIALEKHRATIASAYGAAEIGDCLDAVFGDIWLIMLTFDVVEVRRNWSDLCEKLEVKVSMPKTFALASDAECRADPRIAVEGLGHFFRHVSRDALMSPRIAQRVILGQLEMTLNNGEVPTGGVGFDAEHAALLASMNVFVTTDTQLENLAKKAAKNIQQATHGKWVVEVVTNADQLARALG